MTTKQYEELKKLAESLTGGLETDYKFITVNDIWKSAIQFHKLQQMYLKGGYELDEVYRYSAYNPFFKEVKWHAIHAKQRLSRKQWFILIASIDRYCNTVDIEENLNKTI